MGFLLLVVNLFSTSNRYIDVISQYYTIYLYTLAAFFTNIWNFPARPSASQPVRQRPTDRPANAFLADQKAGPGGDGENDLSAGNAGETQRC